MEIVSYRQTCKAYFSTSLLKSFFEIPAIFSTSLAILIASSTCVGQTSDTTTDMSKDHPHLYWEDPSYPLLECWPALSSLSEPDWFNYIVYMTMLSNYPYGKIPGSLQLGLIPETYQ